MGRLLGDRWKRHLFVAAAFGVLVAASVNSIVFAQAAVGSAVTLESVNAKADAAALAGHNAWMLTSSALVLFMTAPGLALFYGGLVRKKNVLSVMMQCLFLMGIMTVIWALYGYTLAFGDPASES